MVGIEVFGRLIVITLQRPDARNAIDRSVAEGIERAIDRLEHDSQLWVGVLAAEGRVFSVGVDLDALVAEDGIGVATSRGGFGGLTRRERTKPLIAAVDGPAFAGGVELILACDLVVASRHAVFGLPDVQRSMISTGGSLFRLPRLVGERLALELILTGDPISAERAYQIGLVNQLVEPGTVRDEAIRLGQRIAANAPLAVRESRRVVRLATALTDGPLWEENAASAGVVARSEDFVEGPRAFAERRPAVWRGQ